MKISLAKLTVSQKRILDKVKTLAAKQKVRVYLVGGLVRDLILGHRNLDLDVVVEGNAISFAELFSQKEKIEILKYPEFLTATCILVDGETIDFVTARKEKYPTSGSLPVVSKSNLSDDLARRDFSMNSMAVSLNKDDEGLLIDLVNGLIDLKKKLIRVLHDKSFDEDPTRILRAVRFEQRLGFKLENKTEHLLRNALKEQKEKTVKAPRYFAEFRKIFGEKKVFSILSRLQKYNGLAFLGVKDKISKRIFNNLDQQLSKELFLLKLDVEKTWLIYFMATICRNDPKEAKELFVQMQLNQADSKACLQSTSLNIVEKTLRPQLKPSDVYRVVKHFSVESIVFFKLATTVGHVKKQLQRYLDVDRLIKLKINGDDLRSMGIEPYKIGKVLDGVLVDVIDNEIMNKEMQKKIALKVIQQL